MRSIRLFVDAALQPGGTLPLPTGAARHAVRVLRLQPGDEVVLFNGDGHEYVATLTADDATASVTARRSPRRESPLRVTLVQALARGEKMDWIVQKATELGVAEIVPVTTERSEVRLDTARAARRQEHWRAVAIAACEQSGRNVLPRIRGPAELDGWLRALGDGATAARWMLHPDGGTQLAGVAPARSPLVLAVGPEGGFGAHDLAALEAAGFGKLSLGPRVLRTETAGVAALAALQARYGDLS